MDYSSLRRKLARWYDGAARDLPWRRTRDPYAIWISEIMLQQTRVAAVIPYYERFLSRFPRPQDLAAASESEVLTMWAGLGYYSRARNLQKAARQMVEWGEFPREYTTIRTLSGVGDYTAAAVASIAFDLPHAVVDGNVRRVVMRLTGSGDINVPAIAHQMMDRRNPARSNQAVMELGAVICTPKQPSCEICPVRQLCAANANGTVAELPPPKQKPDTIRRPKTLLVIRQGTAMLLVPSSRVAGFWDLPEPFPGVRLGPSIAHFRHAITNSLYLFEVCEARLPRAASKQIMPLGARWWPVEDLEKSPLSTAAKKALQGLDKSLETTNRSGRSGSPGGVSG